MGKAAFENHFFRDGNTIRQAYAWLLVPALRLPAFTLDGGYAFSYSDASVNTFSPIDPLSVLLTRPESIGGFYNPYFTPENQQVHSLLAIAKIEVSKKASFVAKATVGVLASAGNPYLYIRTDYSATFEVSRGFDSERFHPLELQGEMRLKVSRQLSLSGSYVFGRLFFYQRHQGNLALKYLFVS